MLGFKEYLTTSFDTLLSTRAKNFFFLYYGKLLPLLVEKRSFFFDGDQEISLSEGTLKTIKLYAGTSFIAPAGVSFIAAIPPGTRKYYELAAEYLFKNDMLSINPDDPDLKPTGVNNILAIKFFEELYKFKRDLSLKILNKQTDPAIEKTIEEYFEYLKTEETVDFVNTTVYEKLLNSAIEGDQSVRKLANKYTSDVSLGGPICCFFDDKKPAFSGDTQTFPVGESLSVQAFHKKLVKLISLAKKGGDSNATKIAEIFIGLNDQERCYICKRKPEREGNSVLFFIEQQYGKLNTGADLFASFLGCKDLGFGSLRGNVPNVPKVGLAATKCSSANKTTAVQNLNYGINDLDQSLTAVDYDSGYFADFDKAVEQLNDKIDKNLITLVDGE